MLRCVGFRGSKAAGRLGAARRYNFDYSDGQRRCSSNQDESTESSLTASGWPETEDEVDRMLMDIGLYAPAPVKAGSGVRTQLKEEGAAHVGFHKRFAPYRRLAFLESKGIEEDRAVIENGDLDAPKATSKGDANGQSAIELPPKFRPWKRLILSTTTTEQPIIDDGNSSTANADSQSSLNGDTTTNAPAQFAAFKRPTLFESQPDPPRRSPTSCVDYVTPSHLPVSPLMDPSFAAARSKYHLPKPQPVFAELTPFQLQLRNNPYALALATPVRMCNVSRVSLPKFFMQDYNLLAHPEENGAWWMPGGLGKKDGVEEKAEAGLEDESPDLNLQDDSSKVDVDVENTNLTSQKEISTPSRLTGPTVYTLIRKEFLYALSNKKKVGYSSQFEKSFQNSQLLHNPHARALYSKTRWRTDIDEFLLELMRRRVVDELTYILKRRKGYITGSKTWEDALAKPQIGAYLWLGNADEEEPPPEFATLDLGVVKKKKVPTHNLKFLLGREKLEGLRSKFGNGVFENNVLALRHRRTTVEVQMRLWRLQGYLAEYRDTPGVGMVDSES